MEIRRVFLVGLSARLLVLGARLWSCGLGWTLAIAGGGLRMVAPGSGGRPHMGRRVIRRGR